MLALANQMLHRRLAHATASGRGMTIPLLISPEPAGAESPWVQVRDGDLTAWALFQRHYSKYHYADGRNPRRFVGPGERIVLITADGAALFVWRLFRSMDEQTGINCAVFRNEGPILSSTLILEAEKIAHARWPGMRMYTYVNPRSIRSSNPGFCFKAAGWKACGRTKRRDYIILEKQPS